MPRDGTAARNAVPDPSRGSVHPAYLGADYVDADLRAVIAAAESDQSPAWGHPERATLHDLLGDVLLQRARGYQYAAESAAERGNDDASRDARCRASEARQAATREYQSALTLDPTNEEARRALGE